MNVRTAALMLTTLAGTAATGHAQLSPTKVPTTEAAIQPWDVAIVRRATEMLASPSKWNRASTRDCPADAKTFGIYCALRRAVDEATGAWSDAARFTNGANQPAALADCRLTAMSNRREGSCGAVFDELAVFAIKRVDSVTTGRWRADARPTEVWAGTMTDALNPIFDGAVAIVDSIAPKKYRGSHLVAYNNDSTTMFSDVQALLHTLEARLRKPQTLSELDASIDDVEVEIYAGGTGVVRTYTGWFAVSGFSATDSMMRFQIDTARQIPASDLDREIIRRAAAILSSDAVWNRADNRKCKPAATTWSIYCALEQASIEVTGGFHHRRPALELVRILVEDRTKGRDYNHRLMDYNNDKSTHLDDVRSLFADALSRMK